MMISEIDGNKLIAQYMGEELNGDMVVVVSSAFGTGTRTLSTLRYHESWDWLMPVIEKIEETHGVTMYLQHVVIWKIGWADRRVVWMDNKGSKILTAWYAMVEFIKLHNNNPQLISSTPPVAKEATAKETELLRLFGFCMQDGCYESAISRLGICQKHTDENPE